MFSSENGRTQGDFGGLHGSGYRTILPRKKVPLQGKRFPCRSFFLQHLYFALKKLVCAGSISMCFKSQWCSLGLVFQSLALLPLQPMVDLPVGEHCMGIH